MHEDSNGLSGLKDYAIADLALHLEERPPVSAK